MVLVEWYEKDVRNGRLRLLIAVVYVDIVVIGEVAVSVLVVEIY